MGSDKALIELAGISLLDRARSLVADFDPLVIGAPHGIPDDQAGHGPLGGLLTAFAHSDGPILLLAVDLPLLARGDIHWLVRQHAGVDGCVPKRDGNWEPCCAVYHESVVPLARQRLAEGRRSLHGLIEAVSVAAPVVPDAMAPRLQNCNTPEDLARCRRALEGTS
jgi:molybdopterin-guanine dinucleotide biosynthesis protein A